MFSNALILFALYYNRAIFPQTCIPDSFGHSPMWRVILGPELWWWGPRGRSGKAMRHKRSEPPGTSTVPWSPLQMSDHKSLKRGHHNPNGDKKLMNPHGSILNIWAYLFIHFLRLSLPSHPSVYVHECVYICTLGSSSLSNYYYYLMHHLRVGSQGMFHNERRNDSKYKSRLS